MKKSIKNQNIIVLFVVAALIVLLVILFRSRGETPEQYEVTIMELGGDSMLAHSSSDELGIGEMLLIYAEDMIVEDVNGQIIDYAELGIKDEIRIEIEPRVKHPEYDYYLDPVVTKITLLPDDSNDFI